MNLSDLILKVEKFCAGLELDELYLLRGLVVDKRGQEIFREKIDYRIVYLENGSKSMNQEFEKIMKGAL